MIKPRLWPWIELFSSRGQESWRLSSFSNNLSPSSGYSSSGSGTWCFLPGVSSAVKSGGFPASLVTWSQKHTYSQYKRSSRDPLEWEHWLYDYQRTKPREYQIVRTHKRKPLEYNTWHHPTTGGTLCRTPHLNNKQNKNTNTVISRRITTSLGLAHQRKIKQTNIKTQHKSHPIWSLHKQLYQP